MEFQEAKNLISQAKNIYLIPEESSNPEAVASALSLFYTLSEAGKNVNIITENFPEYLKFLIPSADFISYPKNFIISIPSSTANISQIYYEKNDDSLKIHLTVENGVVKKDDISFYFSESKPDLVITFGIKDYQKALESKLNSFGFLLDADILNIDSGTENKNFGKINLVADKLTVSEIVLGLSDQIGQKSANCLMAGLIARTDNFKNSVTPEIFETAAALLKSGANMGEISNNICK
jgi:nanoRNase/pAp phosphatase (c-di-AMP/oligoRNAs hydrolase)